MSGTEFTLEVQPRIPPVLARLEELANDLFYSWERQVRGLFYRLDPDLWERCGHSPRVFLRRIAQEILDEAIEDRMFMEDYRQVLAAYDAYREEGMRSAVAPYLEPGRDLIAYFCAEFGFSESFPIYSGGLGILAGDHCKAASDLAIPFVAVGLLYRQGYFTQTIDNHGNQIAHYAPTHFDDIPVSPARDADGKPIMVSVAFPGRTVHARVWQARAGHITLYLLDTDVGENSNEDRRITYQLYGGDNHTRIQQELILGIGGVRALRALGLRPNIWHINEGHSAFQVLERCRERIQDGLDFDAALELTACKTIFTTHTPVAAGHDIFDEGLIGEYFGDFCKELGIGLDDFKRLGSAPGNVGGFNMTALALRGSRFHNGVSRIHGSVASRMEGYVWPEIPHEENPIGYVTNGVHAQTFLAREWTNLFDMRFREWRNELLNEEYWNCIDDIPDHRYWSLHQSLKSELLEDVHRRMLQQHRRNGCSEALIARLTRIVAQTDADILVMGFARRFATYKRATLLFSDPERLARLLNDPERPMLLIFAGKAHPNDMPGQHLLQVIHEYSMQPEFIGKIILLEGYDLALARKMVTGVDVWLNTPEYPMEASGTSGQKAGMNGVINLSVLDGWWGEGYNGDNGWAIAPHGPQFDAAYRNHEEANDLLDILEREVCPLYYSRDGHGYSEGWVRLSKNSMKSVLPRFNSQRMVMDYIRNLYHPAREQGKRLSVDGGTPARVLANWKKKVHQHWPRVRAQRVDTPVERVCHGDTITIQVDVELGELKADDVKVECLFGEHEVNGNFEVFARYELEAGEAEGDAIRFQLTITLQHPGLQSYKLRIYPYHPLLSHPLETGYMLWL